MFKLSNAFHEKAIVQVYPTSVRVLYPYLLYKFNKAYWAEELSYSQREMAQETNLSVATVNRSLKFLSDRGYIKTWKSRGRTIIKLLGTSAKQQCNSGETSRAVCYTRTREDVKTKDNQSVNQSAQTRVYEKWRENLGVALSPSERVQFETWLEKHGEEWMMRLIKVAKAKCERDRMTFAYLSGFVRQAERPAQKAKAKAEPESAEPEYAEPDDAALWEQYL